MPCARPAARICSISRPSDRKPAIFTTPTRWTGWAIGVARLFALVDKKGGKPSGPDIVKGLKANQASASQGVVTPAGKARIPALIAEENAFLDALARETRDFSEL